MDSATRAAIALGRGNHFFNVMRTALFVLFGTLVLIATTDTGPYDLALGAVIVSAALYGGLAGDSALRDLTAINKDMNEEDAASNFGRSANGAPMMLYRVITALVYIVMALAQLNAL
ncbi:hypothetical protein ACFFUT_06250 [Pseudohalocynthiibacter aestuariivivens]|uniref:Uncharacterized protein n=1 Tax=Pseudohalocynthiibacter aestuariivivens TaxID=1591409 RepID=A0ABV5JFV3_9RHOB|nr:MULTISPECIES: hypothetical protein [Pseudohalocynthiibacter]MBS9717123.1 hypothetical protein [Pseudohalocynthiibacter aestuariivivens]MCK0104530.1 hypothetical protein [Pseudohalocynthiibacter sp. F2068]